MKPPALWVISSLAPLPPLPRVFVKDAFPLASPTQYESKRFLVCLISPPNGDRLLLLAVVPSLRRCFLFYFSDGLESLFLSPPPWPSCKRLLRTGSSCSRTGRAFC